MENGKINDLIFKELFKRGYSVRNGKRIWNIADSKLWYLTPSQAQAWLDVEDSEQYQEKIVRVWYDLMKKNMQEIIDEVGEEPVNIIDLGCGDGAKAAKLIQEMKKSRIRYCPIDISSHMVSKAIKTFDNKDIEIIDFKYNISDFENLENVTPLLREGEFKRNFFLLLGNTLGNFEINELLYEIRSSMSKGDMILIGTGIDNGNMEKLVDGYTKNIKLMQFLSHVPLQLGLDEENFDLDVRFVNSRIELYAKMKSTKLVTFQGKEVIFNKGDEIIIMVAYKHLPDDLRSYLNIHFDQVYVDISEDGSTALALCVK